jgi:large subunit ribosomal protein L5
MSARLKELYTNQYKKELFTELGLTNVMLVPKLTKIVVNVGAGEAVTNSQAIPEIVEVITLIAGQKPMIRKAKKAIAGFKLRPELEIGVAVTLRGDRMWEFFDKFISVVLPRTKDFRGLSPNAFDGRGNYSVGIKEHTVFPEIDTNKVQKIRSLQVTFVIKSPNDDASKKFLDKFGFPFAK